MEFSRRAFSFGTSFQKFRIQASDARLPFHQRHTDVDESAEKRSNVGWQRCLTSSKQNGMGRKKRSIKHQIGNKSCGAELLDPGRYRLDIDVRLLRKILRSRRKQNRVRGGGHRSNSLLGFFRQNVLKHLDTRDQGVFPLEWGSDRTYAAITAHVWPYLF